MDRVFLVDTPGLGEIDSADREAIAREAARDGDLLMLVVDGPLRSFEMELVRRLREMEKRLLVVLNKADWYDEADRDLLLSQLREQLAELCPAEDVVAVSAEPAARTAVRVLPDGTQQTTAVHEPPRIEQLADRLMDVVRRDGRELLLANLLLRSRGLLDETARRVRELLDERAHGVIRAHMWQSGGIAAISPLPLLDVAGGLSVSSKMVLDLAGIYGQPMDLDSAGRLVGELGKNLLAILGAAAVTPTIATMLASAMKTVPGAGTLAGGALQGMTQALVTLWIGRVFMVYFADRMQPPEDGLAGLARRTWREITQPANLRRLIREGVDQLGPPERRA